MAILVPALFSHYTRKIGRLIVVVHEITLLTVIILVARM